MRARSFTDEIGEPLRQLEALGLARADKVAGGMFGENLFAITAKGREALRAHLADAQTTRGATLRSDDSQADLLKLLGDGEKQRGNLDKAIAYYEEALSLSRTMDARKP